METDEDILLDLLLDRKTVNIENAELAGCKIRHANLRGAQLVRANLERAELLNVNLEGANLQRAILINSILKNVILIEADLRRADLFHADLRGVDLRGADLRGADLRRADLTGADLTGADLTGADLREAIGILPARVEETPVPASRGVAFEIHNAFTKFKDKKRTYLTIIDEPDETIGNIDDFLNREFSEQIKRLFTNPQEKLIDLNKVLKKIKGSISSEDKELIYKSVNYAFTQDNNFIRQYIIIFLTDTMNAYNGAGDNTSCVKGIIERFVLCIGSTVQIVCSDGCDNETWIKLDNLMNPIDIPAIASEWFENEAIKREIKILSKTDRKEKFVEYLIDRAEEMKKSSPFTITKIEEYADEIDYAFENLLLGGKKKKRRQKKISRKRKRKSKRFYFTRKYL